jgi:hypothetical protein
MRRRDPMLPCSTVPQLSPIRARSGGSPRAASRRRSATSSACCSSAAAHATAAWPSTALGEFQKAMIASPMYLPTVPPLPAMYEIRISHIKHGLYYNLKTYNEARRAPAAAFQRTAPPAAAPVTTIAHFPLPPGHRDILIKASPPPPSPSLPLFLHFPVSF